MTTAASSTRAPKTVQSSTFEQLRSISHRAATISALGATITIAALLFSGYQLSQAEERRREVVQELSRAEAQLQTVGGDLQVARKQVEDVEAKLRSTQRSFENSRCALDESRRAIEAFHQRDYATAIQHYEEARKCDPTNAYVLNLEAYSMFKAGRVEDAIDMQRQSIEADPEYAWGYFDLARFLCSANRFEAAREAKKRALELRPSLAEVMTRDGEFIRLCRPISS